MSSALVTLRDWLNRQPSNGPGQMTTSVRQLLRGILHLGLGEMLGRVCWMAILIILGHWYGVVVLGVYALAATVTQYLQPVIDFGLRHIGARLMARYPLSGAEIVR